MDIDNSIQSLDFPSVRLIARGVRANVPLGTDDDMDKSHAIVEKSSFMPDLSMSQFFHLS